MTQATPTGEGRKTRRTITDEAAYGHLLGQATNLIRKDVDTRLEIGRLFGEMAALGATPKRIADDLKWYVTEVSRYIDTATYWGSTRIPKVSGRVASWTTYYTIAQAGCHQERLREAAMTGGADAAWREQHAVCAERRDGSIDREEEERNRLFESGVLADHYHKAALRGIDTAVSNFDGLESLSGDDAEVVSQQLLRLKKEVERLGAEWPAQ